MWPFTGSAIRTGAKSAAGKGPAASSSQVSSRRPIMAVSPGFLAIFLHGHPELFALFRKGRLVAGKGVLVAPATLPLIDHRERPPMSRGGAVGIGPVDRVAVMRHHVPRLQADRGFSH